MGEVIGDRFGRGTGLALSTVTFKTVPVIVNVTIKTQCRENEIMTWKVVNLLKEYINCTIHLHKFELHLSSQ
jgi:hypothetical protein